MDSVSVSSSDSSSPSDNEGLTPTHTSDTQQNKVGYNTVEKFFLLGIWREEMEASFLKPLKIIHDLIGIMCFAI